MNRPWGPAISKGTAWLVLLAAMAASTALILYLGRGVTYSIDELFWFEDSPQLGVGGALQPHVGHLVLTPRILYKLIFETLGTGYLPFRLLSVGSLLLTVTLFFVYASRRVGYLVALVPGIVLLFFGSDPNHLLQGNGFTVLLSISCGLGALLALDRRDRRGDGCACALLCLGVATYSVALAFLFAAAVSVLIRDDRWRRAWIVLIPAALYLAWWLWALGSPGSSEHQLAVSSVLQIPAWGFQSLSAILGARIGLDHRFTDSSNYGSGAGSVFTAMAVIALSALATAAVVALALRLRKKPIPSTLWAALGLLAGLWYRSDRLLHDRFVRPRGQSGTAQGQVSRAAQRLHPTATQPADRPRDRGFSS